MYECVRSVSVEEEDNRKKNLFCDQDHSFYAFIFKSNSHTECACV